ncbi:MAG: hypothetical protein P4M11_04295 [Candidatus Pacebacteria bacterium]|nr:hypothetical protein [Candidatus Paceibacterota bacterium]
MDNLRDRNAVRHYSGCPALGTMGDPLMLINSETESSVDPFSDRNLASRSGHMAGQPLVERDVQGINPLEGPPANFCESPERQQLASGDGSVPVEITAETEPEHGTLSTQESKSLSPVRTAKAPSEDPLVAQAFQACESVLLAAGINFSLYEEQNGAYSFSRLKDSMLQMVLDVKRQRGYIRKLEADDETKNKVILSLNENVTRLGKKLKLAKRKYRKGAEKSQNDTAALVEELRKNIAEQSSQLQEIAQNYQALSQDYREVSATLGVPDPDLSAIKEKCGSLFSEIAFLRKSVEEQHREVKGKDAMWADRLARSEQSAAECKDLSQRLAKAEAENKRMVTHCKGLESAHDKLWNDVSLWQKRFQRLDEDSKWNEKLAMEVCRVFKVQNTDEIPAIVHKIERVAKSLPRMEAFVQDICELIAPGKREGRGRADYEEAKKAIKRAIDSARSYETFQHRLRDLLCIKADGDEEIVKEVERLVGGTYEEVRTLDM